MTRSIAETDLMDSDVHSSSSWTQSNQTWRDHRRQLSTGHVRFTALNSSAFITPQRLIGHMLLYRKRNI